MIFGPWIPAENGLFTKFIGDDSHFAVSAPPTAEAAAFIDPGAIRIVEKKELSPTAHTVFVDGTVVRLSMERQSGNLFADVRAGSLTLVVRVDDTRLAAMTLHRGWPVTLSYRPDSIRWL